MTDEEDAHASNKNRLSLQKKVSGNSKPSVTRGVIMYSIREGSYQDYIGELSPRVDTKTIILMHINNNPGIRYKELLRLTGLANGTLEYHLKILERSNTRRRARYYPICIPANETQVIGYIRNNVARQIVIFVLEDDLCTFNEIFEHIKKAASTASWHLNRLSDAGLISIT